ncbi:MAG: hypothetical protein WAT91_09485, partial [Saprospiraceae bacterium]
MMNPWDKIFIDDFHTAWDNANSNYLKTQSDIDLRARGVSSILLNDYKSALDDFLVIKENEKLNKSQGDDTYWYVGLCYYALGDIEESIEYFKFPVTNLKEIKYTSGISYHASLLYYLAVKLKRADLLKISINKLQRQSTLTIPMFLLGNISEAHLDQLYKNESNETLRNRNQCKIEFYKAAAELAKGNLTRYYDHINNCVKLKGKYLEFEYYMAKVEHDGKKHPLTSAIGNGG